MIPQELLKIISIFFSVVTILSSAEAAQKDPYAYKVRGKGEDRREEGRKGIGISAPDLELLSFLGYQEKTQQGMQATDLRLKFYMRQKEEEEENEIFIKAQELVVHEFYLMKPLRKKWTQGWQEFSWPTQEVLNPLKISIHQLGVVGRLNHDWTGSGAIVPLIFYYNAPPKRINKYILYLRPKENLSKVAYKLYKFGNSEPVIEDVLIHPFYGAEPFPIEIDVSNQSAGDFKLVIKCRVRNQISGPRRSYTFYHNPTVSK
jgi:hypothetical protein